MAGRVQGVRSYDESVTKQRTIKIETDAEAVNDVAIRNELVVPDNITPFETAVTDTLIQLSFDSAEKVEVINCPTSPSARSDVSVWFKKFDETLVGPYILAAYADKKLSLREGFIGVELLSDAAGTNVTVEALHV